MPRKQIKRKCGHIEKRMSYVDYKIEYISCRKKEGSYDGKNKTIVVYVPYDF